MGSLEKNNQCGIYEIRESELKEINGGSPLGIALAIISTVGGLCVAAYNKGKQDGKIDRMKEEVEKRSQPEPPSILPDNHWYEVA